MQKKDIGVFVFLFVILVVSRLIPHPANFTAVIAMSLFAGSVWKNSSWKFLLPLFAMVATDFYLGFYPGILFNYAGIVASVLLAPQLKSRWWVIASSGITASVIFFVLSNLGVWYSAGLYEQSFSGLVQCYILAIPFFANTLMSTLFYSAVLYGALKLFTESKGIEGFYRNNNG